MLKKFIITISIAFGLLLSFASNADQVISDNLILQGNQCTGSDCVDGEVFNDDLLRLQENNVRIRFHDTSAADVLGQSWNINANRSNDGGESLFDIGVKSVVADIAILSDGTAPLYVCPPDPSNPYLVVGAIPAGEPIVTVVLDPLIPSYVCKVDDSLIFTEKPVLQLGIPGADFITLGESSTVIDNAVSVGQPSLERKLVNVAAGISATDVLIKQTLNEFSLVADQSVQVTLINQQLDSIESQMDSIEGLITTLESTSLSSNSGSLDIFLLLSIGLLLLWRLRTQAKKLIALECCL